MPGANSTFAPHCVQGNWRVPCVEGHAGSAAGAPAAGSPAPAFVGSMTSLYRGSGGGTEPKSFATASTWPAAVHSAMPSVQTSESFFSLPPWI